MVALGAIIFAWPSQNFECSTLPGAHPTQGA
jgi:hypothetical protein